MNKFEKRALAKRAYRALVKMGEGEGSLYQQSLRQIKSMLPPINNYLDDGDLESYAEELAPFSPAERRIRFTADKLSALDDYYNTVLPYQSTPWNDPVKNGGHPRAVNDEGHILRYFSGLGPDPSYRNRPITGKQVLKNLKPFTKNMKQPIVETYPD